MSFDGQRVVIIGASAGIGEATAKAFAALGADVVITGRSKERLDAAAQRIGAPVRTAEADATDRAALDAFFSATGGVDHLVLTASPGAVGAGPVAALDEAALREAIRLDPDRASAYNSLGLVLRDTGRYDEAEEAFGEAVILHPAMGAAHTNLGRLVRTRKRSSWLASLRITRRPDS